MRTLPREIVSGRSAAAWRRACARATAWMRDISAASSWAAAGDSLRVAEWTASCFGTRLAELTNATDRLAGPPVSTARRRRVAADELRPAGANRAAHAAKPRRANEGARPAQQRVPVAIARGMRSPHPPTLPMGAIGRPRLAALPIGAMGRPRLAASPIGAMGRPRLAALAGDVSRALRQVGGRRRVSIDLPQPQAGSDVRKVAPDLLTARSASISNAALEKRVSARLDRSLARAFGRSPEQAATPAAAATSGWQRRLGAPDPSLVLPAAATPVAAGVATAAGTPAAPARSGQPAIASTEAGFLRPSASASSTERSSPYGFGEAHGRSWRQPISPPDRQLTLAPFATPAISGERVSAARPAVREPTPAARPVVREPTRAAGAVGGEPTLTAEPARSRRDQAAAMVPSLSGDAAAAIEAPKPAAAAVGEKHDELRAPAPDVVARPMPHRMRLDPIEFAEQLRLALIHDARRVGIEV